MAVALDTQASSSVGSNSALSWSHTCTGSSLVLYVDVAVGNTPDSGTTVSSVTYNSVAMSSVAKIHTNNGTDGFVERFRLIGPATGAHTVAVSLAASATEVVGGSRSFTGASQSSGSYPATVTAAGTGTAATVSAVSPAVGSIVLGGHGAGNVWSAVGQTSQYNVSGSSSTGCGCLCGNTAPGTGSNVAVSATVSSVDDWASLASEIPAATTTATKAPQPISQYAGFY